jgi:selenide,water dikinase
MERSLVLTMDVITPIVDDPRAFGAIAAANAMSDVFAMGGVPELALSFVGFPTDKLPLAMLAEVLAGMQEACARAGCAIVGGHTIADNEPKAGLAVVGSVESKSVWSHRSAREGDALVLSKPLGTGIVGQAIRAGKADQDLVLRATAQMMALNAAARDVGVLVGASSCTDVTGFGLLGHLRNIVEASDLAATLYATWTKRGVCSWRTRRPRAASFYVCRPAPPIPRCASSMTRAVRARRRWVCSRNRAAALGSASRASTARQKSGQV